MATWVGIGGLDTRDLIQAGVEEDWTGAGSGSFEVYSWYTMNYVPIKVSMTINPGDTVDVTVSGGWLHGEQQWTFFITDVTLDEEFEQAFYCNPGSNCVAYSGFESADYIVEAPGGASDADGYFQLPAYTSVHFASLQYCSPVGCNYLGNTSAASIFELDQDYLAQAYQCSQVPFCQIGVVPSTIRGTANASEFYAQYLVDQKDAPLECCTISPETGIAETPVVGKDHVSNPSGYSIHRGVNYGTGGLSAINLGLEIALQEAGGGTASTVSVGSGPLWGAYDWFNGYVYIANQGTDTVSVVWGVTLVGTVIVGVAPLLPAVSPLSGYVVVPNSAGDTVSIISGTALLANHGKVYVGSNPHSVSFDDTTNVAYVANWGSDNVTALLGGIYPVASYKVGANPLFAVPAGGYLFVDNSNGASVSLIDIATGTVRTKGVGGDPSRAAWDPSAGLTYVANAESDNVTVFKGATPVANISVGELPTFPAYDPENGYVYVPNEGSNSVTVLNGKSVVAGGTIPVGGAPHLAQFDSNNSEVYVSDLTGDALTVLGGYHGTTAVGNISTGSEPWGIVLNAAANWLYVMDSGTHLTTVVDPSAAPSCYDAIDAPTVDNGLAWAASATVADSNLTVCPGLPTGVYLYQFIVWWVPVGQRVATSGANELMATSWSYSWASYFTVT